MMRNRIRLGQIIITLDNIRSYESGSELDLQ
jgi:hypothetical protein